MKIDRKTTLEKFLLYVQVFDVDGATLEGWFEQLKEYPLDERYSQSFNQLKFKQLIELQSRIKNFDDMIYVPFEVIYNIKPKKILKMSAFDCLRFALFVRDELERVTKLFKEIEYKPTAEEERAGIKGLSHGFFGTIDWYARRMGITNHDEVVELNWLIIYQCLKIDFDNNRFEKRYRQVVEQQSKRR